MVRFSCPNCKTLCSHPTAGEKVMCPTCRQKLLVPSPPIPPPQNKTVLGTWEPLESTSDQLPWAEPIRPSPTPSMPTRLEPPHPTPDLPQQDRPRERRGVEYRYVEVMPRKSRRLCTGIFAFLSLFLLALSASCAGGGRWNGSPATWQSHVERVEAQERFDEQIMRLGVRPQHLYIAYIANFLFWMGISFALVIKGFVTWQEQIGFSRVLLVFSAVLVLPCMCVGWTH